MCPEVQFPEDHAFQAMIMHTRHISSDYKFPGREQIRVGGPQLKFEISRKPPGGDFLVLN